MPVNVSTGMPDSRAAHARASSATPQDTGRFKQFRRGIAQLDEEGVVQVLRDADQGDSAPVLAAVGPMQFEVAVHRLEIEFAEPVAAGGAAQPHRRAG